jgi:acyl dehydratase
MVNVLAHSPFWLRDLPTSVDYSKVVHGEQWFRLKRPLPVSGRVHSKPRVLDVFDKGAGKGAVVLSERILTDAASGETIAEIRQSAFCRGDGGFGGPAGAATRPQPLPDRAPDHVCDLPTRPEAALIYRLSGDYNPLHAEPAAGRAAGYPRPILHGLATFGVAGHAILKTLCGYEPSRLVAMGGRFSAPVYPGETIRTEMWRDGSAVTYRARVVERDLIAINNGQAELA